MTLCMFVAHLVTTEMCRSWEPVGHNSWCVGCHIILLKSQSECTMDVNGSIWSGRMIMYVLPIRIVCRHIRCPISRQLHIPQTMTGPPPAWTVLCWHVGSMDSWGCPHICTYPSARYNWKQGSSDHAMCFQSSTILWQYWQAQVRLIVLSCRVNNDSQESLRLQKHVLMMVCWTDSMLALVDAQSLIVIASVVRLSRLRIHVGCRWSYSVIFWQQWCQRFDVLLDIWYSWYTLEMVVHKNPNFIATLKMLCPISHALTIMPCWKSHKSC